MRAKPEKSAGFLGGLFGGDDDADFTAIKTGYFKGLVRCYNPEYQENKKREIKAEAIKLLQQVKYVYQFENMGSESPYNPEDLARLDKLDADD